MALSNRELDQLAEDTYRNRRITGSIYCGRCGYNLRTLPYVYRCPECGSAYNARPLNMHGIFFPHAVRPPIRDSTLTGLCGVIAFRVMVSALNPLHELRLIVGVALVIATGMFAGQALHKLQHFLRFRTVAKRIAEEEEAG